MKTSRRLLIFWPSFHGFWRGARSSGFLLELLLLHELLQHHGTLHAREMIDEENTLQVIHLMLETGCEKLVALLLADFALIVEIAHAAAGRALHFFIKLRNRKAAFLIDGGLVRGPDDLGIHEIARLRLLAFPELGRASCRVRVGVRCVDRAR